MKIKQVEELVGITRKNIRFYEEQGLLSVERAENGYREYSLKDVKRLQEIRFLRKLLSPSRICGKFSRGKEPHELPGISGGKWSGRKKKEPDSGAGVLRDPSSGKLTLEGLDARRVWNGWNSWERRGRIL